MAGYFTVQNGNKIEGEVASHHFFVELDVCGQYEEINHKLLFHEKVSNIDVKNDDQDSPLHIACYWCNSLAISVLIEHGANVNLQTRNECSPLEAYFTFYWTKNSSRQVVSLFVQYGVDPKHTNYFDRTLVHLVCDQNDIESAKFLISQGYSLGTRDKEGRLPIDLLCQENRQKLVEYMELINCR